VSAMRCALSWGFLCTNLKHLSPQSELELELIQSHMAQKPVLRGEVGCACVAREVSVERGGMGGRSAFRRWFSKNWRPRGGQGEEPVKVGSIVKASGLQRSLLLGQTIQGDGQDDTAGVYLHFYPGDAGDPGGAWRYSIVLRGQQVSQLPAWYSAYDGC